MTKKDFNIRTALEAIGPVKDTANGARTACPFHNGTNTDNFSLYPSGAGRCWSDCGGKTFSPAEMAVCLGVEIPAANGVTLEEFLTEFSLPQFIADQFGLRNEAFQGQQCVIVPHLDERGALLRDQRRLSLHGGQRFNWKGIGNTSFVFGLHRLAQIRQADFCLIVEGVSDVLCAAAAGVPALGIPGAGVWREEYRKHFNGLTRVSVWQEPGEAGRKFVRSVGLDIPTVKVLSHSIAKDPAELYRLVGRDNFKDLIEDLWNVAPLASQLLTEEVEKELEHLRPEIGDLLNDPLLVERIESAIKTGGFVGDIRPAMLVYLAMTGRTLTRPPNLKLLGRASSGKNAAIDVTLQLFPETAYLEIDAGTPAYLVYSGEQVKHRAVIMTEMDSMPRSDTNFASFLRTLIDKGRAVYRSTLEGQRGETRKGTSILVEGPIAFITTGIRDLDSQAHSRMLTQPIDDDPKRVREVTRMQEKRRSGDVVHKDLTRMQALQRYLELSAPYTVVIPFWDTVVDLMDEALFADVRQNRDADQLLAYIESLAVLYQGQRPRDGRNRIVASIDDYGRAVSLLDPLFRLATADGVTESDRDAYEAVLRLQTDHPGGVKNSTLAVELSRSPSTVSGRVKRLHQKGLLKDLAVKKHEHLWKVDSPLPEESGLPSADSVRQASVEASAGNPPNTRTLSPRSPVSDTGVRGFAPLPRGWPPI